MWLGSFFATYEEGKSMGKKISLGTGLLWQWTQPVKNKKDGQSSANLN